MHLIRQATAVDADAIARVHVRSICALGARYYSPEIVAEWGCERDGSRYVRAMERGEIFFVSSDAEGALSGFSSWRLADGQHRTAVYVDPRVARTGVGSALFHAAEGEARRHGAKEIYVDASLTAAEFYRVNGFETISEGEHRLNSGAVMACVFMRKRWV